MDEKKAPVFTFKDGVITIDGKTIDFDLNKITRQEYLGLFDPKESADTSDASIARVAGISFETFRSLSLLDSKRLMQEFFKRARDPLADPKD